MEKNREKWNNIPHFTQTDINGRGPCEPLPMRTCVNISKFTLMKNSVNTSLEDSVNTRNRYLRYYTFGNPSQECFSFYMYRLKHPGPRMRSPAQFSTRAFLILVVKNHGINIARVQWHPQLWKLTASERIKIEDRAWRHFKEHKKSFLYLMNFI